MTQSEIKQILQNEMLRQHEHDLLNCSLAQPSGKRHGYQLVSGYLNVEDMARVIHKSLNNECYADKLEIYIPGVEV